MFGRLINRYRGRHQWPSVTASISSADWRLGGDRSGRGFYDVAYTFWIAGHIYSGSYNEPGSGADTPYYLKPDDPVAILYDPQDPNVNFNPEFDAIYNYGLVPLILACAVAACLIATAIFVLR